MNTDKRRSFFLSQDRSRMREIGFLSVIIGVCLSLVFFSSCSSKPTNLRSLAPADSLVYLETNDLGAALEPIIGNKAFELVAKNKPDLSALRGVQLSVAVTGFETREEKLTEENSVGRVQPHFAAIADTHAWSWQTRKFAENQLGEFINTVYGGGITLDTTPKDGGTYYVWKAEDGRKAYAYVEGSLIFFGNDESSIDKCLAVKRGEADSIQKNPKLPQADPNALAQGYVSTDGVAQIANIVGLAMASQTGEEEEVKSFIAGALPQILRSSVSDVSWTESGNPIQIEDKYLFAATPDVSNVLSETLVPSGDIDASLIEFLPIEAASATLYNLKDPRIAWRSVLLVTQKQSDPAAGKILTSFSGHLFEPYAVADAETFLSVIGSNILTTKLDDEGQRAVVIAMVRDKDKVRKSLAPELRPNKQLSDQLGLEVLQSPDGEAVAFFDDKIIAGDGDSVVKCINAKKGDKSLRSSFAGALLRKDPTVTTYSIDNEIQWRIAEMFGEQKADVHKDALSYVTETRFTKNGIERKTVSDFGLIGSIIAQLAPGD